MVLVGLGYCALEFWGVFLGCEFGVWVWNGGLGVLVLFFLGGCVFLVIEFCVGLV